VKRPILIRLPRPPRDAFALPLPSDAAKAKAERYRRLFAALAAHADVVVDAAAKGALTHDEALAALLTPRAARQVARSLTMFAERARPVRKGGRRKRVSLVT
jgi:hypothetical protein